MSLLFEILVAQGRTTVFTGTLYQTDGVTGLTLQSSDELRCKLGRGVDVPLLDLVSTTPTPNGSSITIVGRAAPATYQLKLAQADMAAFAAGTYDVEVLVIDAADSNLAKVAGMGVLHVLADMAGNLGA